MKKLTPAEVEKLFPRQLYADWMHTGDSESVRVDVVHGDDREIQPDLTTPPGDFDVIELSALKPVHDGLDMADMAHDAELLAVLLGKNELHFDSGNCAICLDGFEDDDVVRGLICGHVFHAECVDPWLTRRRACCPICKRDYYKEEENANAATADTAAEIREGGVNEDSETTPDAAGVTDSENANTTNANASASPPSRDRDRDDDSINYDMLRADPNLQALLSELIPLSERVRVILEEHPLLNLEARGREIATQKFRTVWRIVFWKLMGISREDMFNWAVITIFHREHGNDSSGVEEVEETVPNPATETATTAPENVQITTTSSVNSVYHNATDDMGLDVSEAARREVVERRV